MDQQDFIDLDRRRNGYQADEPQVNTGLLTETRKSLRAPIQSRDGVRTGPKGGTAEGIHPGHPWRPSRPPAWMRCPPQIAPRLTPWPATLQRGARQLLPRSEHRGLRGLSAAYVCPFLSESWAYMPPACGSGKGPSPKDPWLVAPATSGDSRGFSPRAGCAPPRTAYACGRGGHVSSPPYGQ